MSDTSFLPQDYVDQLADRRTNVLCLTLFFVVIIGVAAAFWVTNRQWNQVNDQQAIVNTRYEKASEQINELTELDRQKKEMLDKAELAASLVEKVPRSILLAELINRMPDRLSVLEFTMRSDKIKKPAPDDKAATGSLKNKKPKRAPTKQEAGEKVKVVEAPDYRVSIMMKGVAPTDLEVSRYIAELNAYSLLREVRMEYSEESDIGGQLMREFKIHMVLSTMADVRQVDPLIVPKNPMGTDVEYTVSSVDPDGNTSTSQSGGSTKKPARIGD